MNYANLVEKLEKEITESIVDAWSYGLNETEIRATVERILASLITSHIGEAQALKFTIRPKDYAEENILAFNVITGEYLTVSQRWVDNQRKEGGFNINGNWQFFPLIAWQNNLEFALQELRCNFNVA